MLFQIESNLGRSRHLPAAPPPLLKWDCSLILVLFIFIELDAHYFGFCIFFRKPFLPNSSSASAFKLLPSSLLFCPAPISKSWVSCSGRSTMYPFPVRILYPLLNPSFPTILPSTRPSLHFPLTFTEFLISTTLPSLSLLTSALANCCFLSSSALKYFFNQRLRTCSMHRVMIV